MSRTQPTPRPWRIVHSEVSLGWGGQEHRILAELSGFQERGCQVWLLAPRTSELFTRALSKGIAAKPLAAQRWQFPFAVLQAAAFLRGVHPDVVNTHSSRDGWIVGLAARLARVPFVVRTRHFDVPVAHRWLSGFVFRRLADHVLTTSPKVTAHFQELFHLPEDRITTLPTGVDVSAFSSRGPTADLVSQTAGKKLPLVGMVSIVRRAKGHETLLRAAQILAREEFAAQYVIVGEGPYLETIREKARALGLTSRITFAGHREDVPSVLRSLDVLVIPSLHEGIPQIGLQALACETPVIGSNAGGIPQIIRDDETGRIFRVEDAAQLASRIQETLAHPDETRRLAKNGRALVEAEYSLDTMIEKLDAIYRRYLPL